MVDNKQYEKKKQKWPSLVPFPFMMKLFGTTDINVIKDCQAYFGTQSPSEILTRRRCKFLKQYRNSSSCLCRYFCD